MPDFADSLTPLLPSEAGDTLVAERITALLERQGIPPRQQAAVITQLTGISPSQARRKLRGAMWLFSEVLSVAQHFGESLDSLFLADGEASRATPVLDTPQGGGVPARFVVDSQDIPCQLQVGPLVHPGAAGPALTATYHADTWWVGPAAALEVRGLNGPRYSARHIAIDQPAATALARVAVVDDDLNATQALADWFNATGFDAQGFTCERQLLDTSLDRFDAFVVDLILDQGRSSRGLVEKIRHRRPDAPIVLLTGQLRDGHASEGDLTTLVRTQGVTFFEKPVRPAVLSAAIQSGLDRLCGVQARG